MLDFRATVVPYEGATGPHVVLTHEPIEPACAEENPIGMRPACDPANDVVTAVGPYANRDCEPQRTFQTTFTVSVAQCEGWAE